MTPREVFFSAYQELFSRAQEVVLGKERGGVNSITPPWGYFPEPLACAALVVLKALRVYNYLRSGNLKKMEDELLDLVNYAGFLYGILRLQEGSHEGFSAPSHPEPE